MRYWPHESEPVTSKQEDKSPQPLLESLRTISKLDPGDEAGLDRWMQRTKLRIRNVFNDDNPYLDGLARLQFESTNIYSEQEEDPWTIGTRKAINLVETMLEDLEVRMSTPPMPLVAQKPLSGKVFVVHGHDG